jgi:HD-GYP domain-containing protein (c-di-GMP phosphodiesterase class II)
LGEKMSEFQVKEIQHGRFFSKSVFLDNTGFIIIAPEMPFTEELTTILEKWSFNTVYCEGEVNDNYIKKESNSITNAINSSPIELSQQTDTDKIKKAEDFYINLVSYVEQIFIRATISDELSFNDITEKIKSISEYIKEDRRFLMRVIKNIEPAPDKNYLATHSVRSTIISIIIGTYLKLPNHRLIELGIAAFVHEAGMLKLPSNIYLSQRPLNSLEQKAIFTHPVLGYSMLKSLDFPLPVCLVALEHHERENATGYPRHLTSDKISLYSKIIAVACSYEALSSKRPHKEAKDGYSVMLELLKNEGKSYDDTIVKALVLSLSIYPIGLYVLLSNDKKGQVVDVNPENPKFPIVQVFGEHTPDGKIKTVQTAANELLIVRPLNRSEIES